MNNKIILGVVVAVAVIGGLLLFSGSKGKGNPDQNEGSTTTTMEPTQPVG